MIRVDFYLQRFPTSVQREQPAEYSDVRSVRREQPVERERTGIAIQSATLPHE